MEKKLSSNPISFPLAFSHLEIFANRLWRASGPDTVDFTYGRIWLHTLELAHRWRQTTAADALAQISFSLDSYSSKDEHHLFDTSRQMGGDGASRKQPVWSPLETPRTSGHGEGLPRTSGHGEGLQDDNCLERISEHTTASSSSRRIIRGMKPRTSSVGGVAEEEEASTKKPQDASCCRPLSRSIHHRHCCFGGATSGVSTNRTRDSAVCQSGSVLTDKHTRTAAAADSGVGHLFCFSNPEFDRHLYFKSTLPPNLQETKTRNRETDVKLVTSAMTSAFASQATSSGHLCVAVLDLTSAFEQYVSGHRLFVLSLLRSPSISIEDDGQLSSNFRFSEPGCLSPADAVSLVRIPIDLSGADDRLLRIVQVIQSDHVRLLWLTPQDASSAPPLSYQPPVNEQNRSQPGPIRRPFAVPWRLRHKNAYVISRCSSRNTSSSSSIQAALYDVSFSFDPTNQSDDSKRGSKPGQSTHLSTHVTSPSCPPPPFPVAPESAAVVELRSAVPMATASAFKHGPPQKRKPWQPSSSSNQDARGSRWSSWSKAMSTKGRLWDDNDLIITDSSRDFDEMMMTTTTMRQRLRRSLSDFDLTSFVDRDRSRRLCRTGNGSTHGLDPGQEGHGPATPCCACAAMKGRLGLGCSQRMENAFSRNPNLNRKPRSYLLINETSKTSLPNAQPRDPIAPIDPTDPMDPTGASFGRSGWAPVTSLVATGRQPIGPTVPECLAPTVVNSNSPAMETSHEASTRGRCLKGNCCGAGKGLSVQPPQPPAPSKRLCPSRVPQSGAVTSLRQDFFRDPRLWADAAKDAAGIQRQTTDAGLTCEFMEDDQSTCLSSCSSNKRKLDCGVNLQEQLILLNIVQSQALPPDKTTSAATATLREEPAQHVTLLSQSPAVPLGHVTASHPRIVAPCCTVSVPVAQSGDRADSGEPDRLRVIRDLPASMTSFHYDRPSQAHPSPASLPPLPCAAPASLLLDQRCSCCCCCSCWPPPPFPTQVRCSNVPGAPCICPEPPPPAPPPPPPAPPLPSLSDVAFPRSFSAAGSSFPGACPHHPQMPIAKSGPLNRDAILIAPPPLPLSLPTPPPPSSLQGEQFSLSGLPFFVPFPLSGSAENDVINGVIDQKMSSKETSKLGWKPVSLSTNLSVDVFPLIDRKLVLPSNSSHPFSVGFLCHSCPTRSNLKFSIFGAK